MKPYFLILLCITFFLGIKSSDGQEFKVAKDLRPDWQVHKDGKFVKAETEASDVNVVYFTVNSREHNLSVLRLRSGEQFSVFINNNLAAKGSSLHLRIDSLAKVYASTTLSVAIFQKGLTREGLTTDIGIWERRTDLDYFPRRASGFNDFAITGILLLMIFAIVIVRLNPKLASDYFSISKIISAREIDDAQTYTRIGSSTNILFYIYSSMLLAYYLIIAFHFLADNYSVASGFDNDTFLFNFLHWLRLSGIVLLLLMIKIILIFGLSYLFGIPEIAGVHFFNWVRLLLVVLGVLSMFLFLYVIWHGHNPNVYSVMMKLLGWFTVGWMMLIFLKLNGKTGASMFHLFSYICATELIPFLFIIKVLYN